MVEPESQPAVSVRPSRGRSVAAAICIVIAALLTVPAATAFWGQRTLNDAQRYLDTVGPLVESPEVQAAIANRVTGAIQQQVDVEALLNQVFAGVISDRPRLQSLVGPMSGAVNGLIESQVRNFIASDTFAEFWTAANTRAQAGLVRLLQGDQSGAISLQGDQVVLDLSQVIAQVKERLVARAHNCGTGADPGQGPADRAAGRAPAEPGPHHLRVRQPGGPLADRGRRGALPRRLPAIPAQAEDDHDHRGRAGRQRTPCGPAVDGRPAAVRQPAPAPSSGQPARSSSTSCCPTCSEASRCSSGSA